jgi:hypothetical protein
MLFVRQRLHSWHCLHLRFALWKRRCRRVRGPCSEEFVNGGLLSLLQLVLRGQGRLDVAQYLLRSSQLGRQRRRAGRQQRGGGDVLLGQLLCDGLLLESATAA